MIKEAELPAEKVDQILRLLKAGQKQEASSILEQHAISKKWKSFEVHHMAQHLLRLSQTEAIR